MNLRREFLYSRFGKAKKVIPYLHKMPILIKLKPFSRGSRGMQTKELRSFAKP
jgi:hypothetical protein